MTPTNLPPFTVRGVTFRAHVDEAGCYVWQSECGRFRAWRTGKRFEASFDGQATGRPESMKEAMRAAVERSQRRESA